MEKKLIVSVAILFLLPGVQTVGSEGTCGAGCGDGKTCDTDNTCKISEGGNCTGNAALCKTGTLCEKQGSSRICKIQKGGHCDPDNDLCVADAFCNASSLCTPRKKAGDACSTQSICDIGLTCDTADNKCKISEGGNCETDTTLCKTGTFCEKQESSQICKIQKGGHCDPNNDLCVADAFCNASSLCTPRKKAGDVCSTQSMCDTGLTCDTADNKCKIQKGGHCDPDNDLCVADAFCDARLLCSMKAGDSCQPGVFHHCLWNGQCENSKCLCKINYVASEDKRQCSGGLAAAVVSLPLVAASVLFSRLF